MNLDLSFATNTSLGAGIALVALASVMGVLLWARPQGGASRSRIRELLAVSAGCGAILMMVHLAALIAGRGSSLGACAATTVLAGATVALGWSPTALQLDRNTKPRQQSSRQEAGSGGPSTEFPNYTQIKSRLPVRVWQVMRAGSLLGGLGVVGLLVAAPATGLFVMWRVVIPCLPLLFMVAPGLWRNLCPLAAANQTPRALEITRSGNPPAWLKQYGYVIAFSLFIVFVALRRLGLDRSGAWSALLLFGAMASAFTGGMFFKGKSGWCSTICPLLPVQRIYGQTPLVTIANAHCQPCVGCAKNCYDFSPKAAYLADLHDPDTFWSGHRRLFVGAFPGLVLSFFVVPRAAVLAGLGGMALFMAVSVAAFTILAAFVKRGPHTLTSLFGALAFMIFYWFAGAFGPTELTWLIRIAAITLAATWFVRTIRTEKPFLERAGATPAPSARTTMSPGVSRAALAGGEQPAVTFLPGGERFTAQPELSLLELAEANGIQIEAGCRMGICGADPVAITDGVGCTSPISEDERATLERLGLAENTRMACCVRVSGPVTVSLTPEKASKDAESRLPRFVYDKSLEHVVVVGNGIAGVTAADQLRRRHPEVTIDLIAAEPHHLYNRMGISRLVYARSAMQGLYLNPDAWYEERDITAWLNTSALSINPTDQRVALGTGESLPYDRLILATGARSAVPAIAGFGLPGTGVLRSAADAIGLRAYAQRKSSRTAVVAGGGLLGLEAAYALRKLGMRTIVLERSERLLRRQLDARAGELLQAHLEGLGIEIRLQAEVRAAQGDERLQDVELRDGHRLAAQILLVAAGIQPNAELARNLGLEVNRGVLVDDRMRTSDPAIYAVGDVAEYEAQLPGLWATAVAQAEVAAENAAGGDRAYMSVVPATTLKVAGIDLTSIGRFDAATSSEEEVVIEDPIARCYRKLLIADGRIAGAILLGAGTQMAATVRSAISRGEDISDRLTALRAGRWETISEQ